MAKNTGAQVQDQPALADVKCPECGSHKFSVHTFTRYEVDTEASTVSRDHEDIDENVESVCADCGHYFHLTLEQRGLLASMAGVDFNG